MRLLTFKRSVQNSFAVAFRTAVLDCKIQWSNPGDGVARLHPDDRSICLHSAGDEHAIEMAEALNSQCSIDGKASLESTVLTAAQARKPRGGSRTALQITPSDCPDIVKSEALSRQVPPYANPLSPLFGLPDCPSGLSDADDILVEPVSFVQAPLVFVGLCQSIVYVEIFSIP